jgi:hypothetical protein
MAFDVDSMMIDVQMPRQITTFIGHTNSTFLKYQSENLVDSWKVIDTILTARDGQFAFRDQG